MNQHVQTTLPAIGESLAGGFYAGNIIEDGKTYALIVAPKATGEFNDQIWIKKYKDVPAAKSYSDGKANTLAMAAEGSEIATIVLTLDIDGFTDWHIPAQDELEICYRNLKPNADENSCWGRSGINLSSEQKQPYTHTSPVQTSAQAFIAGGSEAFDERYYWTSTQYAGDSDYAWYQFFGFGYQYCTSKFNEFRVRAVRRLPL